jgi:hypothetical protein
MQSSPSSAPCSQAPSVYVLPLITCGIYPNQKLIHSTTARHHAPILLLFQYMRHCICNRVFRQLRLLQVASLVRSVKDASSIELRGIKASGDMEVTHLSYYADVSEVIIV